MNGGNRALSFPLPGWIIVCNMLCRILRKRCGQAFSNGKAGTFLSAADFYASHFFGAYRRACQPLADVFAFLPAIPLGLSVLRELKNGERTQATLSS